MINVDESNCKFRGSLYDLVVDIVRVMSSLKRIVSESYGEYLYAYLSAVVTEYPNLKESEQRTLLEEVYDVIRIAKGLAEGGQ